MLGHYYDPYRSVPEINKGLYYNYQPQVHQPHTHQQIPQQQSGNKWVQTWNGQELERDSSHDSYYSNNTNPMPKLKSMTPSPRKMLTSSFAENGLAPKKKGNSRSPQRIYKTHSDLNKVDKMIKKTTKSILKDDNSSESKKDRDVIIPVDISAKKGDYEYKKEAKADTTLDPVSVSLITRTKSWMNFWLTFVYSFWSKF